MSRLSSSKPPTRSSVPAPAVGDILLLHSRHQPPEMRNARVSFAIFAGRGRVVHVWSSTGQTHRVRSDSLRMLETTGNVFTNVTATMDGFCHRRFNGTPADRKDGIAEKARTLLHAQADGLSSSLLFALWARYDDTMAKLTRDLRTHSKLIKKIIPFDLTATTAVRESTGTPRSLRPNGQCRETWILGTPLDRLLSTWIAKMFDEEHAVNVPRCEEPLQLFVYEGVSLRFDLTTKKFVEDGIELEEKVPVLCDRLISSDMECGICNDCVMDCNVFSFECSHFACTRCYFQFRERICPYCRQPISSPHILPPSLKLQARRLSLAMTEDSPDTPSPSSAAVA